MPSIRPPSSRQPISAESSPTSTTSSARSRSTHAPSSSDRIIGSSTPATTRSRSYVICGARLLRGNVWRGELRNRAKDGSIYWVDTTIVPFLDGRGKPRQYLAIRSDITQRKLAETQLREQSALAHLGQLAAVVAHEVRNPLAGLRASLQVLDGRVADVRDRDVIAVMIQRIDGLNDKVNDLLLYARPKPPRVQATRARARTSRSRQRRDGRDRTCRAAPPCRAPRSLGAGRRRHAARRAAQPAHQRMPGGGKRAG